MTKGKNLKFKIVFMMVALIPMIIACIVLGVIAVNTGRKQLTNGLQEELYAAAVGVEQYFKYDILNTGTVDYNEYRDHKYMMSLEDQNIELTLFKDDTRFLTSIKKEDGSYNEGVQCDPEIYEIVRKGEIYFADNVKDGNGKYMVYYMPLYDSMGRFWGMAFAGKTYEAVNAAVNKIIITIVLAVVLMIILVIVIDFFLIRKIEKALASIVTGLDEIESGNLNTRVSASTTIAEFNQLADMADSLALRLKSVIGDTKATADELGVSVVEVDKLISDTADSTAQIAHVVHEMSTTALSMADTVQDTNSYIIEMGNSIDVISDRANASLQDAHKMLRLNEETASAMDGVSKANEESVAVIRMIDDLNRQCNAAVAQIKETANVIGDIAGQTNLLSLNASIEAARAGEIGRGFAVVAENIKDLAEKSKNSADEIGLSVDEIVEKVARCVQASTNATGVMQRQSEFVKAAQDKVVALSGSVRTVSEAIDEIGNEAVNLNTKKESVLSNVTDLSAISEENAASSEEVSASVETVSMNVEGTKIKSNRMGTLSYDLLEKVKYFKL